MEEHVCHHCGATITLLASPKRYQECPQCGYLLHVCDNCQFFDVGGCVLGYPQPFLATHGSTCDKFQFRTPTTRQTFAA